MIRPRFAAPLVDEQALREAVQPRLRELAGRLPEPQALAATSAERGIDFATAWLREALLASEHGPLQASLDGPPRTLSSSPRLRVLVVPTLFWREHPEIGGDGRLVLDVARRLGFEAERAPLRSVGGLEESAERLLAHLERSQGPLALVSLSKGGLDVKRLLARFTGHPALERVSAWANVAGLTGGTPLVDRLFRHPALRLLWGLYLRWHGGSLGSLRGLGASQAAAREPAVVPARWRVLSLPALPLRGHLLPGAVRGFERLAPLGPNDGLVPFWNAVVPGGEIGALWGCDHYVRRVGLDRLIANLLVELAEPR
jgi:hypothetical protein